MKVLQEEIALFDMDGTLCDYDKAMQRDMNKLKCPQEILPKDFYEKNTPRYLIERTDLIKNQPGWWENLEKFKLGFDILKITKKLGFKTYILTKGPSSKSNAWAEKVKWCKKNIPDASITITEDKGIAYGKILVDDYPTYIKRWLENRPRGLVIMPSHEYNKDFKHPNVIRYDGTNLQEIISAIKQARLRRPKENIFINKP